VPLTELPFGFPGVSFGVRCHSDPMICLCPVTKRPTLLEHFRGSEQPAF
jgi:hypothetical protein